MTHAWLRIEDGHASPNACELIPGRTFSLGRHATNSVVLRDEHASRWHAIITPDGDRWLITNVGSPANATRLNGTVVSGTMELRHGDEIIVGHTRLRFSEQAGQRKDPHWSEPGTASVPLPTDELTALHRFIALATAEADPRTLVRQALQSLYDQTAAALVGFLSLDADQPLPKMVYPEQKKVDVHLSRQLTQLVQSKGQGVWLAGGIWESLVNSMNGYTDAICLPLRAADSALGALHIYRADGLFHERHQWFAEALGGYLASSLYNLRARRRVEADNQRLRNRAVMADELVGNSSEIRNLRQKIARASACTSTVLIHGESGVGKELVALALHRQGPRHDGPLVVVNCAAISHSLMDAELFGHCKGAFTGADRDRPGLFQQADEGTLFLDEIGELPLDCQAKLLRVAEGHGFRPVGAATESRVDLRIIAATNRDLEEEVRKGRFRQDLLFRLQVIQIAVPPLREHREDIPELTDFFLARIAREFGRPVPRLSEAARKQLIDYAWPGNVRQLLAVLESAVAMSEGPVLDVDNLALLSVPCPTPTLDLGQLEGWAMRQALRRTGGNITQAAKLLGVVRDTLMHGMKRHGIVRRDP